MLQCCNGRRQRMIPSPSQPIAWSLSAVMLLPKYLWQEAVYIYEFSSYWARLVLDSHAADLVVDTSNVTTIKRRVLQTLLILSTSTKGETFDIFNQQSTYFLWLEPPREDGLARSLCLSLRNNSRLYSTARSKSAVSTYIDIRLLYNVLYRLAMSTMLTCMLPQISIHAATFRSGIEPCFRGVSLHQRLTSISKSSL
jgi:hypothetical protein